ncbi:TPA: hypothetical protein TVK06_000225 [Streptococcus equi subsp. zooepidemicus]|nr:hypothetical protein [Streptococcus equi subsp. zooepidemicus]HEL1155008.1 hypothetical protein [Streptococcus equi subsp. zooepidemicus]
MQFFQNIFRRSKKEATTSHQVRENKSEFPLDDWKPVPSYVAADKTDYQTVSLIASAIAAGEQASSQFKVKRILKRNPEALTVSLIASSIAAGVYPESQFLVRSIYSKKVNVGHK